MHVLDVQLLLLINRGMANALFDRIMPALSQHGYLLAVPFVLGMLMRSIDRKDGTKGSFLPLALGTLLTAFCAVVIAHWTEDVMKAALARVRPCHVIAGTRLIVECPKSFSMPSGHAITSFACALPLFLLTREYIMPAWRIYPLILASVIAFSRLYLGLHYPSDVLAGVLLGSLIGSVLSHLYRLLAAEEIAKRDRR